MIHPRGSSVRASRATLSLRGQIAMTLDGSNFSPGSALAGVMLAGRGLFEGLERRGTGRAIDEIIRR